MAEQSKEIVACGHFTIKTKLNKLNIPTFWKNKKGTSRSGTWLVALRPSDQNHFPKLPVECSNSKNMWFLYSDWCFLLCERVAGCLLWSWVKLLLFAGGSCGFERRRTQSRAWERAAGLFRNRSLSDAAESARFIWGCLKILLTCLSVPLSLSSTGGGGGCVSERRKKCLLKWESCCWSSALRSALIDWLFYDFSTIKFLTLARYSFMLQGPREKCRFVKIISLKWIRNIYFP